MHIIVRPMRIADIAACAGMLLLDEPAYDSVARKLIPRVWYDLLTKYWCEAVVVEDLERPKSARIAAYAFVVFLAEWFAAQVTAAPHFNRQILDAWRQGRSPLLDRHEVACANSGTGVWMHTFHESFPLPLFEGKNAALSERAVEEFIQLSRGYNIKEMTIEVYGQEQLQWNLNGGFRLRTDYSKSYENHPEESLSRNHPYLIGLNRAEAVCERGTTAGRLFSYTQPRIYFNSSEQEVLKLALQDLTDEQIAAEISLSTATVRKRWMSIYEHVELRMPNLLRESTEGPRGLEKRRSLLGFLRSSPQELRPHLPP